MQCALLLAYCLVALWLSHIKTNRIVLKCGVVTALIDHDVFHMFGKANTLCILLPIHCWAAYCSGLIGEGIFWLFAPLATIQLWQTYQHQVKNCSNPLNGWHVILHYSMVIALYCSCSFWLFQFWWPYLYLTAFKRLHDSLRVKLILSHYISPKNESKSRFTTKNCESKNSQQSQQETHACLFSGFHFKVDGTQTKHLQDISMM